jgi:nitrate/nitrite-specific signal transduction histidine kinase
MNKFAAYLDAYANELARLADSLNALHRELSELRDELRGVVDDQRQEPLPLRRAA